MKHLSVWCLALFLLLPGLATADTFDGTGPLRVDACKSAKDKGRFTMENKYSPMNTALYGKNKVDVGECDCSENPRETGYARWKCIVDVEIVKTNHTSPAPPPPAPKKTVAVVSRSGMGETTLAACEDAKWKAAKAVQHWGGTVVDAGECTCGLSGMSGSLLRYECNVDSRYEK